MKKLMLVTLVAGLSLAVAAPAMASSGRPAPADAHIAKKKCKKKKSGKKRKCKKKRKVVPPAPTPKPLADAEVINQVRTRAAVYCAEDPFCVNYGYYYPEGSPNTVAACSSKSTYQWACFGWIDEEEGDGGNPELTCRFREIIDRVGIDGITSHQDLSLNPPNGGWICVPWET
jgi:hypothetical protein